MSGYDGSEHSIRAARHAAALANQLRRDLVIVHVAKRGDEVTRPDPELVGELHVVHETGDPADVLVRVARERAAALIVTGTRGRNALSSALLGSVCAGVVGVADRPVGLVPAGVRDA